VAVHFSTPLRLYQPYACATDTDGEGQKNGQKLTHQSGEEPFLSKYHREFQQLRTHRVDYLLFPRSCPPYLAQFCPLKPHLS
ncbi:hypothetical protein, partial [Thiolapillus sp.]